MTKTKVKQHTKAERLALRRKKRKEGPSALRRKAKRAALQPKPVEATTDATDGATS